MKKDLVFLAEDGVLTSTSAAHLRNLAAQKAESILSCLNSIRFINKYIQLIGSDSKNLSQIGLNKEQLSQIPDGIQLVVYYQAFEAWINEAITAKDRLFSELRDMEVNDYIIAIGKNVPECPNKPKYMTEDDYLSTLTVKERNEYFMLQTQVAAIGKLIHKDSPYDRAMKELQDAKANPIKEILNGRDTILHISEASVTEQDVNDIYFKLQKLHREAQAQLNGMKNKMNEAIKKDYLEKTEEYNIAYKQYYGEIQMYNNEMAVFKKKKLDEIEKLKIVIPKHLEAVYKDLTALGK